MSASLLISNFLRNLPKREIPPEIEEHRVRLKRSSGDTGTLDRQLARWAQTVQEWSILQQQFDQQRSQLQSLPGSDEREKEIATRESAGRENYLAGARELVKVLEELNQRILSEAPSLENHDELLRYFKERQVYQADTYMVREFVPQDERTNTDYRELLETAVANAIEQARATFVPEVKKYSYMIGGLAFMAVNAFLASVFLFEDSPLRMSVGLLLCFDVVIGMGYVFIKMSRSREEQLRQHIQAHIEEGLTAARGEIARREEERYTRFMDEERERRENYERDQQKKREAFDRLENARLEALQPLFSGKVAVIQTALASLFPLRLPVTCPTNYRVHSAGTVEVTIQLPEDKILPPHMLRSASRISSQFSREELDLNNQCVTLAAALAIRHAAEILYNIPSCQNVVVNGVRAGESNGPLSMTVQVLNAEIDRRTLGPMGRTASPLMALKRFKHRISGSERREKRSA